MTKLLGKTTRCQKVLTLTMVLVAVLITVVVTKQSPLGSSAQKSKQNTITSSITSVSTFVEASTATSATTNLDPTTSQTTMKDDNVESTTDKGKSRPLLLPIALIVIVPSALFMTCLIYRYNVVEVPQWSVQYVITAEYQRMVTKNRPQAPAPPAQEIRPPQPPPANKNRAPQAPKANKNKAPEPPPKKKPSGKKKPTWSKPKAGSKMSKMSKQSKSQDETDISQTKVVEEEVWSSAEESPEERITDEEIDLMMSKITEPLSDSDNAEQPGEDNAWFHQTGTTTPQQPPSSQFQNIDTELYQ